jgi:hypothetical protein
VLSGGLRARVWGWRGDLKQNEIGGITTPIVGVPFIYIAMYRDCTTEGYNPHNGSVVIPPPHSPFYSEAASIWFLFLFRFPEP